MNEGSQRTIEELIARYELEPDLVDVFVEGQFDVDLLQCALDGNTMDYTIYSIDSVYVSADILLQHSLTSGNKQRVLVLARELSASLPPLCRYVCIVDKDLDQWLDVQEDIDNLHYTRFASLEMHFLETNYIQYLTTVIMRAKISDFDSVFKSFCDVLVRLYCLRLAAKELAMNLELIDPARCLTIKENELVFDFDDYVQRCANKSCLFPELSVMKSKADEWTQIVGGTDFRQCVHGHDFTKLLSYLACAHSGIKSVSQPDAIPRFFLNSAKSLPSLVEESNTIIS